MADTPALSSDLVEAFIAAEKLASIDRNAPRLIWEPSGIDNAVSVLSLETVQREQPGPNEGLLRIVASYQDWKHWNLLLYAWDREQVYSWHFKESGTHSNVGPLPDGFPAKAPNPHEHCWVHGRDLNLAKPLTLTAKPSNLRECFDEFCQRIHLTVEPEFVDPPAGRQDSIFLPGEPW